MHDIATLTHHIGNLAVMRITEQAGPGFTPAQLFPDWDDHVLAEMGEDLIKTSFAPDLGRFHASIHSWLFRLNGKLFLVDTCAGNDKPRLDLPRFHMQANPYIERLAAAGVQVDDVDYVLCTHLHADHCGWNTRLINGRWVPTFPNARYLFSRREAEHWATIGAADRLGMLTYNDSVLPIIEAGRETLLDGDETLVEGLSFYPTPGHSPGHCAIRLHQGSDRALFTGDIMHQPVQVYRPEWNSAFCSDAQEARMSRRWALETAAETGATVFTAHFAGTSAGMISEHGGGFDWRFANAI